MGKGFITTGLIVAALLPAGCLNGDPNEDPSADLNAEESAEPGGGIEAEVLGVAEGAFGLNARLRAKHSTKCMSVYGGSTSSGTRLVQSECDGSSNQRFHFIKIGKSAYVIVAAHSGQCLSVVDASMDEGAYVIQWPCDAADNQRFRLKSSGGYFSMVVAHSERCVTVEDASMDDGAAIVQCACELGDSQRFSDD